MPRLDSKAKQGKVSKLYPSQIARPTLGVRVTPQEARWLRRRARQLGTTLGEVVARFIREEHDKAKQERADRRCGVAECIAPQAGKSSRARAVRGGSANM